MAEMKKVRIREAKPRDLGLFRKLWKAFLREQFERGSTLTPSDYNMEMFDGLFKTYVEDKSFEGFVLFVGEQAVLMVGNPGAVFETSLGKIVYGWGTYVTPEFRGQKLALKLYEAARVKMLEMGFDHFCTTHMLSDDISRHVLERAAGDKKLVEVEKNISISRDNEVIERESNYVVSLKEVEEAAEPEEVPASEETE